MRIKPAAKQVIRILAEYSHRIGLHSGFFGPPRGFRQSHELAADPHACTTVYSIRQPGIISRMLPQTIEQQVHPKFYRDLERDAPACFVVQLEQGRTVGSQGVILSANDYIVADVSRIISNDPYSFSELYSLRFPKLIHTKGTVGVIAGSGGAGYFHWLYDVFPKLALIKQSCLQPDVFIVGHYNKRFVRDCMDACGIHSEDILPADSSAHYEADRLLATSLPGLVGNPPQWVVDFLRDTLLAPDSSLRQKTGRRIYISRRDAEYRHVLNETEVEQYLHTRGFETVVLSGMSIREQAQLFNSADLIVAPHGAGLSNVAFCCKGTRLIEIFAPNYVNVCYWSISNLVGVDYWYLLGSDVIPEPVSNYAYRTSITVDMKRLPTTLELALK